MKTTNKEIKEKEERRLSFKQEIEKLKNTADEDEYAKQLAHIFFGNGLSLQTILLMAIDFGQQHPHWIPVEDRLPEENGKTQQSVSVWATNGLITCEMRYNFDTKTWTDMWGDPFDITHWMSLPQPPRKEE